MKIVEQKPTLDIDLPTITADSTFTVWNKDTKKYEKANYIKETGLPSSSHILIYYGLTGQGKTSLLCSLVTSKKKGSKVYRLGGVFDKIYICGRQLLEDGGGKGPRVRSKQRPRAFRPSRAR